MRAYVIIPLFVVCVLAVMASVQADTLDAEQEWTKFKSEHNRHYATPEEESHRKQIFLNNLREIQEHNAKYERGEVTYKKGINQFADETADEFVKKHTGLKIPNQ